MTGVRTVRPTAKGTFADLREGRGRHQLCNCAPRFAEPTGLSPALRRNSPSCPTQPFPVWAFLLDVNGYLCSSGRFLSHPVTSWDDEPLDERKQPETETANEKTLSFPNRSSVQSLGELGVFFFCSSLCPDCLAANAREANEPNPQLDSHAVRARSACRALPVREQAARGLLTVVRALIVHASFPLT